MPRVNISIYSCLVPLLRGAAMSIVVVGVALYAGYSCVAVVRLSPGLLCAKYLVC